MKFFSCAFNKREAIRLKRCNSPVPYKSSHMFDSYFLESLCYKKKRKSFQINEVLKHLTCKRVRPDNVFGRSQTGGVDIFQCKHLIFPLNENNLHWVFFCVDPITLQQKFYDSLHHRLTDKRKHISQCIHQYLIDIYSVMHIKNHPCSSAGWSMEYVQCDASLLGNSHQGSTVDCLLHVCVVPILIVDNQKLNVLGNTNADHIQAGIELRRRMALNMHTGNFMFKTEDILHNNNSTNITEKKENVNLDMLRKEIKGKDKGQSK